MSSASIQSLTILAVVTGSIITIEEDDLSGDAAPTIAYLRELAQTNINRWPETGNQRKNTIACMSHCQALSKSLEASAKLYTACCLGMLSQLLLIELRDVVRDPVKLNIIDELLECVNTAVDIYDPGEKNEESRAEAERLVDIVKKQVGMT